MLENMTAATFSEVLNTKFRLQLRSPDFVELELIKVEDFATSSRQVRFSILFRGPLDQALLQGMYRMEHDQLGTFDLFIVPIAKEDDGILYEAVFNRIVKQE